MFFVLTYVVLKEANKNRFKKEAVQEKWSTEANASSQEHL